MLALLCCLSVLFKCKRSLLVDPIGELQFGNEKIKSLIFWIACEISENQGLERVKWHEIGKMQLLTHKPL